MVSYSRCRSGEFDLLWMDKIVPRNLRGRVQFCVRLRAMVKSHLFVPPLVCVCVFFYELIFDFWFLGGYMMLLLFLICPICRAEMQVEPHGSDRHPSLRVRIMCFACSLAQPNCGLCVSFCACLLFGALFCQRPRSPGRARGFTLPYPSIESTRRNTISPDRRILLPQSNVFVLGIGNLSAQGSTHVIHPLFCPIPRRYPLSNQQHICADQDLKNILRRQPW